MKRTAFFALSLLVSSVAFAAITLDTQVRVGNEVRQEILCLEEDESARCAITADTYLELSASACEDGALVECSIMRDADGEMQELARPTLKAVWGEKAEISCQSSDHEGEFALTIVATQK